MQMILKMKMEDTKGTEGRHDIIGRLSIIISRSIFLVSVGLLILSP